MKRKVWGPFTGWARPAEKWPASARDSQTWLDSEGNETQLLAEHSHVQREGLITFGGYASPTQQRRAQKKRNAVWKLPTWCVGLKLVMSDCSPEGAMGWWWTDGKGLAAKLREMPAGRARVQTVAAVCVVLVTAWERDDLVSPVGAAWPIVVRAARELR